MYRKRLSRQLTRAVATLAVAAPLLAACGDQIQGPSRTTQITMRDNSFSPQTIIIARGSTVRWTNSGSVAHRSVGANNAWNSGDVTPGQSFSREFTNPGTFAYSCTLHAGMTGTIIVD
jgi:plastocyanin